MRKATVIGLSIGFIALCMYSRAKSEESGPPPQGSYVSILQPMLSCDTQQQIKDIADAKVESDEAMAAKIDEYAKVIDKNNEPSCVFGKLKAAVAIGESVILPELNFGGTIVQAWAVHVGTEGGDWYVMYLSPKSAGIAL